MANIFDQIDPDINYYNDIYSSGSCLNYTCREFNDTFKNISNLFVMHLNIRSLYSNWDEFTSCLDMFKLKFSVIVITETWLDSCSLHYNLPGYKAFHTIRQNGRGGGVSIFVENSIDCEHIKPISSIFDSFEISAVKIKINN